MDTVAMVFLQQYDSQCGGKPLSDILWHPKLYILNSKSKKPTRLKLKGISHASKYFTILDYGYFTKD